MSDSPTSPDEAVVAIEIPASSRHVALVRTTAVGVVAELDADMDQIENLRLAVNELVSLVLEATSARSVRVEFRIEAHGLHVLARPSEPGGAVVIDELARRILATTASEHQFFEDGSAELRIDVLGATRSG